MDNIFADALGSSDPEEISEAIGAAKYELAFWKSRDLAFRGFVFEPLRLFRNKMYAQAFETASALLEVEKNVLRGRPRPRCSWDDIPVAGCSTADVVDLRQCAVFSRESISSAPVWEKRMYSEQAKLQDNAADLGALFLDTKQRGYYSRFEACLSKLSDLSDDRIELRMFFDRQDAAALSLSRFCAVCGLPEMFAPQLLTHHWYSPPAYSLDVALVCPRCNSRLTPSRAWGRAGVKILPWMEHVLPSFELQKMLVAVDADYSEYTRAVKATYSFPLPLPLHISVVV